MNRRKITVAVTGLNNIDSPGPGIPVIRGIRDSSFFDPRIIGLAYENLEPGIYMKDLVDKSYLVPYPSEGSDALMNRILEIHARESIDVVIPNFDAELTAFMKAEKMLLQKGIHTFLPTLSQFNERSKSNLPTFGEKYEISVPESISVFSASEMEEAVKKLHFPVLVKGKYYEAYIANSIEQAQYYLFKISSKWGLPVVVQQFVEGTEVNVIALGDGNGTTIGAVAMRKTYITDKGKAWGGITIDEPRLMDLTRKIISSTKWKGGMELEIIKDLNDEFFVIEINPRIPAWVYLAVGAGQNIPEALVKLALGIPVQPFEKYAIGKMFVRFSYDMIIDIKDFEKLNTQGEL